jgi:hypothetical protein
MDSKLVRVAHLTWRPWQSSSARRAELSVGAPCPGGRTRCPPAPAAGGARSSAYGTGCGTETGPTAPATSALESDLVLQHGGREQQPDEQRQPQSVARAVTTQGYASQPGPPVSAPGRTLWGHHQPPGNDRSHVLRGWSVDRHRSQLADLSLSCRVEANLVDAVAPLGMSHAHPARRRALAGRERLRLERAGLHDVHGHGSLNLGAPRQQRPAAGRREAASEPRRSCTPARP